MDTPRDGWPDIDRLSSWLADHGWEPCGTQRDESGLTERWCRGDDLIIARGETDLARAIDAWAQAERRRSAAFE